MFEVDVVLDEVCVLCYVEKQDEEQTEFELNVKYGLHRTVSI
jgi:hypothetical protein